MPPKVENKKHFRSMAVTDQITQLNLRADALLQKHHLRCIQDILKEKPDLILGVVKHLESKGIQLPSLDSFRKRKSASSDSLPADGNAEEPNEKGDEASGTPAKVRKTFTVQDENPANWIPHAYTRLDNARAPLLEALCSAVEDISLSPYMLKALKPKGTTATAYCQKLCEVIEYASCFDASQPLTGNMRHIPTLKDTLKAMSQQHGNRAKSLRLPADWGSKDGVYKLEEGEDGQLRVRHVFRDLAIAVPQGDLFLTGDGKNVKMDELEVQNNFSEKKAIITWAGSPETILLAGLPWPASAAAAAGAETDKVDKKGVDGDDDEADKPKVRRKLTFTAAQVEETDVEGSPSKA